MTVREPHDAYFDAQFTAIQERIRAGEMSRLRRRRWVVPVAGGLAALALTGGAFAIALATQAEQTVALCYGAAATDAPSTQVGSAPADGLVKAESDIQTRVAAAEEQCEAAWRIGRFTPEGATDGTELPTPPLFTCLLRDGRLGVFPIDEGIDCEALGLTAP